MPHIKDMLKTQLTVSGNEIDALSDLVEACYTCAETNVVSAEMCLRNQQVTSLRECIRHNQTCADICLATARLICRTLNLESELVRKQLEACSLAAEIAGDECARHINEMKNCRTCADACHRCVELCNHLLLSRAGPLV